MSGDVSGVGGGDACVMLPDGDDGAPVAAAASAVVAYGCGDDYLQGSRMRRSEPPPTRSGPQPGAMRRPARAPGRQPAAAGGAGAAAPPADA